MSTPMIDVHDNATESRFETVVDGVTAFAEYELEGDRIAFTHTIVPKPLEGRGIGSALIRDALEAVRRRELRVVPLCSFVAFYMERHPETHDLLLPGA